MAGRWSDQHPHARATLFSAAALPVTSRARHRRIVGRQPAGLATAQKTCTGSRGVEREAGLFRAAAWYTPHALLLRCAKYNWRSSAESQLLLARRHQAGSPGFPHTVGNIPLPVCQLQVVQDLAGEGESVHPGDTLHIDRPPPRQAQRPAGQGLALSRPSTDSMPAARQPVSQAGRRVLLFTVCCCTCSAASGSTLAQPQRSQPHLTSAVAAQMGMQVPGPLTSNCRGPWYGRGWLG